MRATTKLGDAWDVRHLPPQMRRDPKVRALIAARKDVAQCKQVLANARTAADHHAAQAKAAEAALAKAEKALARAEAAAG